VVLSGAGADRLQMVQLTPLPSPSSLASFKSRLVIPFWYRLTQVVLEKRPLNGCSVVVTTILRLSYDNAKVTIDLRRTTNLPNRLTNGERLFLGMVHLQNCKRSYDKLTIILR